jgi:hypothetical protein
MAQKTIVTGATAGDGTGEPLFDALTKVNQNFSELYQGAGGGGNSNTSSPYTLPAASASTRGGVRVGAGLTVSNTDTVDVDGVEIGTMSGTPASDDQVLYKRGSSIPAGAAPPGTGALPAGSTTQRGGFRVGDGLAVGDTDQLYIPGAEAAELDGAVLDSDKTFIVRGTSLYITTRAKLLAGTSGGSGGSGGTVTLLSHAQTYHGATDNPPVDTTKRPAGVTLLNPNSNIAWLRFGRVNGNIKSHADLDKFVYYRNNEGDLDNTTAYPNQGASANWSAVYRNYPEFMSDGTTPDPANLHVFEDDFLDLVGRTRVASSYGNDRWEMGYMRMGFHMHPGQYLQIEKRMSGPKRDGISSRAAWEPFWMFSVSQPLGTKTVVSAAPSLEVDVEDCFPEDNARQGASFISGTPLYGYASDYGNPDDIQIGTTGWRPGAGDSSGAGARRLYRDDLVIPDPTEEFYTLALDWRTDGTMLFIYNGQVIRKRHCGYDYAGAKNSDGTYKPMRIELGNQIGCKFNPVDLAWFTNNDDAANPIYSRYSVRSIGLWDSNSNADIGPAWAPPAIPGSGATVIGGTTFAFRDTPQADQHVSGAGTNASPLRVFAKMVGNDVSYTWLGTAWDQQGTRTIRMRPTAPPQDSFQTNFAVWDPNTQENVSILNLYAKGYSGFGACYKLDPSGNGKSYSDFKDHDALGNYLPYYARVTRQGSNFVFSLSYTGLANSFYVIGTVPVSETSGNMSRVGINMQAQNPQGYPLPIRVDLFGYEATSSTDPQAAVGSTFGTTTGSGSSNQTTTPPAQQTAPFYTVRNSPAYGFSPTASGGGQNYARSGGNFTVRGPSNQTPTGIEVTLSTSSTVAPVKGQGSYGVNSGDYRGGNVNANLNPGGWQTNDDVLVYRGSNALGSTVVNYVWVFPTDGTGAPVIMTNSDGTPFTVTITY